MGYPLRGFDNTTAHRSRQVTALRERLLTYEGEIIAAATHGPLYVAFDASGGFMSWRGNRALGLDLRLAGGALTLAFVCIGVHTRSLLLGLLGIKSRNDYAAVSK
jgi:hypothetical protein